MYYEGGMVHCVTQQQPISLVSTNMIQIDNYNKRLINTIDILGKETKQTNQPLFYIYDDGTVEKKIILE
jgi:hypothetical protein